MRRTRGEWRVTGGGRAIEAGGVYVASVFGNSDVQEGNAHIMAASPDMYDALEALTDSEFVNDAIGWYLEPARKALAKARGKEGGKSG